MMNTVFYHFMKDLCTHGLKMSQFLFEVIFISISSIHVMPHNKINWVFPSAYAQDMSFNYLTTDNGLSQFTVYALYNDEWGQIWIGTRDGLNVYNGNRIKTYKEEKGNPTTLLGRTVRRICGNGKGLIYVLTTEGVSELDMKTETFTHISDKQKEWMTAITYCDGKFANEYWTSTQRRITCYSCRTSKTGG